MHLSYKLGNKASGDSLIANISTLRDIPSFDLEEVHIFFDDKIIKLLSRLSSSRDKLLLN